MARQSYVLIAALLGALPAFGQGPAAPAPAAPAPTSATHAPATPKGANPERAPLAAEFANVRKALDALTPEQQKRFQENFLRWSNLSPEEKKNLRDRDAFRRKKMAEDVEAAISQAGLNLNQEKHDLFVKRYAEERRKLEEQLRKEIEERRKPLLKAILEQLKTEFSASSEPVTAPATTPGSPSPAAKP